MISQVTKAYDGDEWLQVMRMRQYEHSDIWSWQLNEMIS